jgi:hypothetical protein
VNEALLPILADRVAALQGLNGDDPWASAFTEEDANSALELEDAARLNRFSHISETPSASGAERGVVVVLPRRYAGKFFRKAFGLEQVDAAITQFGCKDYAPRDSRFRWLLIQVQAACDHAQRQPGALPFVLALEMPELSAKDPAPQALWSSPAFQADTGVRVLKANARFAVSLGRDEAKSAQAMYRIREQLLNDLIHRIHSYGSRPGIVSFRKMKAKPTPKPKPAAG